VRRRAPEAYKGKGASSSIEKSFLRPANNQGKGRENYSYVAEDQTAKTTSTKESPSLHKEHSFERRKESKNEKRRLYVKGKF